MKNSKKKGAARNEKMKSETKKTKTMTQYQQHRSGQKLNYKNEKD
jgi:hypothetical protein